MNPEQERRQTDFHLVPVTIFGQDYSLRAEEDPTYVETLAEYVDARIREVADRTRTADTAKLTILAALNIADDLHRLRRERDETTRSIKRRASELESLLDEGLTRRP